MDLHCAAVFRVTTPPDRSCKTTVMAASNMIMSFFGRQGCCKWTARISSFDTLAGWSEELPHHSGKD